MAKKVIIIGTGGHGKAVAEIVRLCGDRVLGYLDDNKTGKFNDCEILGTSDDIGKFDAYYFAAVGDNYARQRMMEKPVKWYCAVHPSAVVSADSVIGEGVALMANAVVGVGSTVGRGAVINTAASVDHDNSIGDFVHVSPGAHLAGTVSVGAFTWIGSCACVINNLDICGDVIVGAGGVVLESIREPGTYVGVPVRKIK